MKKNNIMKVILLKVRKEKGFTLKQLEEATGIGISTIQRIEVEEISPTLENLDKIAKALGVKITDLFIE